MNLSQLKRVAKEDMRSTKPSVFIVSIIFLILTLVLSFLISNLSGYTQFNKNMTNLMTDTAFQKELTEAATDPNFQPSDRLMRQIDNLVPKVKPLGAVLALVISIMSGVLTAGYEGYCLTVSRHKPSRFSDIFSGFEHFGKVLLIIILQSIFVFLWSLLFIIPGIIALIRYSQSFMVMFDHPEYSALQCIRESKRLMRGHKGTFFVLILSFIGWYILDMFLQILIRVPVLQIYINPYVGITTAHFYNVISGWTPEQEEPIIEQEAGNE